MDGERPVSGGRGPRGRAPALAIAGIAGAAIMALAAWSGGFGGVRVGGQDLYGHYLGKHRFIAERFGAGELPLWNPYEFCGVPLLGLAQGSVLYPPVAIANLIWSPWVAMQALYAVHATATVYLMIRYLGAVGIGLVPAAAGGVLTAATVYNGLANVAADHPHCAMAVPWVVAMLLAWERVVARRPSGLVAFAGAYAALWFIGYPEFPLDAAALFAVMALLTSGTPVADRIRLVAVGLALGTLLAAAQILPLYEAIEQSARLEQLSSFEHFRAGFGATSLPAWVGTIVSRWGVGPALLALVGLATPSRRWLPWIVALLWSVLPTHRPFVWLYLLPPFTGLRFWWAWSIIAAIFTGCFAARGVERLRMVGRWGVLAAAVGVCLCLLQAARVMSTVGSAGTVPAPDWNAYADRVQTLQRLVHDGWPRVASRLELETGLTVAAHIPSPAGYEPAIPPARMMRLLAAAELDRIPNTPTGSDIAAAIARHPALTDLLGIGIAVVPAADAPTLEASRWREAARLPDGMAAMVGPVPHRVHVVGRAVRARDPDDELRLVTAGTVDLNETVVHSDELPPLDPAARGTARVVEVAAGRLVVDVSAEGTGLLVLRDAWFPGWYAAVDGVAAGVHRVDWAFRGVVVPTGRHAVELWYSPPSCWIGAAVSLLALCLAWPVARWCTAGRT